MRKLRWVMDGGGFWDLDVSTPITLDGSARPVPGDPLPLGLSRGPRLSRSKQIHFMQCFMTAPFVPSYNPLHGFSLQRVLTIPFPNSCITSLLAQFDLQKFVSSLQVKGSGDNKSQSISSWFQSIGKHLSNQSLYSLGVSSDVLLTPDATLLLSVDSYGNNNILRKKALLHHKFPHHDLTIEAVWPGLFIDKCGQYWDVPLSMAIDLASIASNSEGLSYHLSMHHNVGQPSQFKGGHDDSNGVVPPPNALLAGSFIKSAISFKKNLDIWRSKAEKLKMAQPYDIFLSNSHITASGIVGAAVTTSVGENAAGSQTEDDDSPKEFKGLRLWGPGRKYGLVADIFGSVSFSAQYGNFQRLVLDLTRFHARLDYPSGSKFLVRAASLVETCLNSGQPSVEAVKAIMPNATLSLQQQIVGPVSFRVDSGLGFDRKEQDWCLRVEEPVFALEYALQVLGSAKAIAWYSPKHREFMVELRFFEA